MVYDGFPKRQLRSRSLPRWNMHRMETGSMLALVAMLLVLVPSLEIRALRRRVDALEAQLLRDDVP